MSEMRELRIEKVTLNMCFGNEQDKIDKGIILLKMISGLKPVKTRAKKRIPNWKLRPGLPIGCMVTLRGKHAEEVLSRLVQAKEKRFKESSFDKFGNFNFGIPEYIDIPEVKYDPDLGIMGLQVCVTLERQGYRVKKRKLKKSRIARNHVVTKQDAIEFMNKKFGVEVAE